MSSKLVECVPNFSEGINRQTIDAIANAVRSVANVRLLDVDPGESTNRTVYTIVGEPNSVIESVIRGAKVAYELIDMTVHKGEHKRLGAMDVCPFIPLRDVTMDDCCEYARICGRRLAEELQIPIYLYGFAAEKGAARKTVPEIREGEYESLATRFNTSFQAPNFGPAKFIPRWGASIVGARKVLIAYNINLIATKEQANRIAIAIRSQKPSGAAGRLEGVQAMGWILKEHNIAQVTVNILDHEITPLHAVYEAAKEEARLLQLPVTGSELVGLVPRQALLDVAEFYINREGLFVLEEDQKIHLAVQRLGLNSLSPFNPKKRVIEYMVDGDNEGELVKSTLSSFVYQVGDRTTAPGGGSVGAAVGALGAALGSMVAKLAFGKKVYESTDKEMRKLIPELHNTFLRLLTFVDKDTAAFDAYSAAMRLPATNQTETEIRDEAIFRALMEAIDVPLTMSQTCSSLWPILRRLAPIYNTATKSDFQVALHCLHTAIYAGFYNVQVNYCSFSGELSRKHQLTKSYEAVKQLIVKADQELKDILAILA